MPRYFFMHLEKTGGTSFARMLTAFFGEESTYPAPADLPNFRRTYPDLTPQICTLMSCDPTRLQHIRLLQGHFPFIAGSLLPEPPHYLVFLRHPVSRIVSHLKHAKRFVPSLQDRSLEEILESAPGRRALLHNPLTRAFSFRSVAEACRHRHEVTIDDARYTKAVQHLQACAFIGLTEYFEASIRLCEKIFGWQLGPALHLNKSEQTLPQQHELTERILPYVQYDLALYAEARRLHRLLLKSHSLT